LRFPSSARRLAVAQSRAPCPTSVICLWPRVSVEAFRDGLEEHGYIEGRNIVIERRSAEGDPQRLPELPLIWSDFASTWDRDDGATGRAAGDSHIPIVCVSR
jgi:hypothetical protein